MTWEKYQTSKKKLSKEFEIKELGELKYFLGIEVSKSEQGIMISQHKYVVDLLNETGMLGCKPASTPIKVNHHLCSKGGGQINKEGLEVGWKVNILISYKAE